MADARGLVEVHIGALHREAVYSAGGSVVAVVEQLGRRPNGAVEHPSVVWSPPRVLINSRVDAPSVSGVRGVARTMAAAVRFALVLALSPEMEGDVAPGDLEREAVRASRGAVRSAPTTTPSAAGEGFTSL